MAKTLRKLHLHLVSDATGETTHQLGRAGIAQFQHVQVIEHVWTLVRTAEHLVAIENAMQKHGGVALFSLADRDIREKMEAICARHNVLSVSVLDHVVHTLSKVLGKPETGIVGGQHRMDRAYFDRMEALDFTMQHDDGQGLNTVGSADILIVGVSRSSKTPTSIYLSHRGYKVANYPLVPGVAMPLDDIPHENLLVVGLIKDARSLAQIRRNRLVAMNEHENSDYADLENIAEEVANARRLFNQHKWPVIDVTRRSVEETAAAIINLHSRWLEDKDGKAHGNH
ncbi:MAG: kinase/pyrophosphorylase [Alphaproteobacteria bacterium]|nr:kinase/pyrophosphorylase [Alphaproteobacteria bacterium]